MNSSDKNQHELPTENDLINLWKYFNDRMFYFKDVLLKVLTWLLAIALAILGFMVQNKILNFKNCFFEVAEDGRKEASLFAGLGILLCFYCFYLVYEYGKIINDNWLAAGRLRDKLDLYKLYLLRKIFPEPAEMEKRRKKYQQGLNETKKNKVLHNIRYLPPFCKIISIPVIVFLLLFSLIFISSMINEINLWISFILSDS